ncbi:MAG: Holliday junction branch migration protein RuvA [Bacteroidales bacterium]|nr:Holliday junction branch migration protein RuvA [Bacteroidales bacterium]
MLEYLSGTIIESTPAYVVLDNQGVGYFINISITTFTALSEKKDCKLFIHEVIREDAHALFGFADKSEREIFRYLISVSGIGANTARVMLSSLTPEELKAAIATANVNVLKSIKGIGAKSAERIIVDLKDKLGKDAPLEQIFATVDNTMREEALSALGTLGFSKNMAEKAIDKILASNKTISLEQLVKEALKIL